MKNMETPDNRFGWVDSTMVDAQRVIQRIEARTVEIGGGITVNRLMPSTQRRKIGAWCFLDHAGPAVFESKAGLRVGAHPHIGLQTFTWMIKGEVQHRDSLGNVQVVRPGQVNLMTAGRGITHTEESLPEEHHLHATQLWIALPEAEKNCAPAFDHHPDLPMWSEHGLQITVLVGAFSGRTAPGRIYSPLVGLELLSQRGGATRLSLDPKFEYGILPLEGMLVINGQTFASNELAYLAHGLDKVDLQCAAGSRALLLGGAPFTEEVHLWWNFVAHEKSDIVKALNAWNDNDLQRFGKVEGFEGERLSAPELPLGWLTNEKNRQ